MPVFVAPQINQNSISDCFFNLFQTMPSLLLDRKLVQLSDPPQTRATPPPSPSATMTLPETCRSTLSLFPRSLSTPRRSVSSSRTHTDLLYQSLILVPGQRPATLSMTAPHTGCYLMATALLLYMPAAHDQSVLFTLSPSHVTLYYVSTRMSSRCEYSRHGEKDS